MGLREILVKIVGTEDVSAAAKKSESAVEGLTGKVKAFAAAAVALGAGAVLAKFFKSAVDEAAQAEVGMARLGVAVRNSGNDFDALKPQLEGVVASVLKMSTATDDELREALTRMIAISGDVKGSMENLALVTDLAAFKNVDLETAAISLGKAMNGNTTELNRLGIAGKDSTTVLENARKSFGGFASEMSGTFSGSLKQLNNQWGEFKEAIGKAILGSGEASGVIGGLAGWLGRLATWVDDNSDKFALFTDALHSVWLVVADVASAVGQALGPSLGFLAKLVGGTLVVAIQTAAFGFRELLAGAEIAVGGILSALGFLVEKGGSILKVFGVSVVSDAGASLRKFGDALRKAGTEDAAKAATDFTASMKKIVDVAKGTTTAAATEVKKAGAITKQAVKEVAADHLAMEMARQKASAETEKLLQRVAVELKKQNLDVHSEQWEEIDRNVRKLKGDLSDLLPPVDKLKESIDENNEALKQNKETAKDVKDEFKDTVNEATRLGHGLIDAASAAGVLDKDMASVLGSVVNVADSLASLGAGFSVGGLAGVIGGIANVISIVGSSNKQLQSALDSNRSALDRLSREVGNFNLGATGKTFAATEKAIAAAKEAYDNSVTNRGKNSREAFRRELLRQGVSVKDAEALLEELGFGEAFKSDGTFGASLGQISQGLKKSEFGQFGQDFEQQFRATTEGFGINKTGAAGQFEELSALAGRFSPALKAALASGDAEAALKGLFDKLKTGDIDAAEFGDLNAGQFLDLIKSLLGLLDEEGGGGVSVTPSEPLPPPPDVDPGKLKAKDKPTIDFTPPRVPLPPLDPELIDRLLGAAGIDPSVLPGDTFTSDLTSRLKSFTDVPPLTPPLGSKPTLAGGGGEFAGATFTQEVAQLVQGDQHFTFQIVPNSNSDPDEIAETVAQRLAARYTLQLQALGRSA